MDTEKRRKRRGEKEEKVWIRSNGGREEEKEIGNIDKEKWVKEKRIKRERKCRYRDKGEKEEEKEGEKSVDKE